MLNNQNTGTTSGIISCKLNLTACKREIPCEECEYYQTIPTAITINYSFQESCADDDLQAAGDYMESIKNILDHHEIKF